MPKTGSGKNRAEAILMDIQASHAELILQLDEILEHASKDTQQDLRDDGRYAAVHKRVEIMQDLPDCQLRGHLNLLAKELCAAIADDLGHTAGDAVRKAVAPLRDKVNAIQQRAHDAMNQLKGGVQ